MHDTFWTLLRDSAHWEFEIFLMLLFDGLIVGLCAPFVRKHWQHHIDRDLADLGPSILSPARAAWLQECADQSKAAEVRGQAGQVTGWTSWHYWKNPRVDVRAGSAASCNVQFYSTKNCAICGSPVQILDSITICQGCGKIRCIPNNAEAPNES